MYSVHKWLALLLLLNPTLNHAAVHFKQELSPTVHWYPYALMLLLLFVALLLLAKYAKKTSSASRQGMLVEQITLHHKSKAYIIEYQGQAFLIADNQRALAIQPIKKELS